MGSRVKPTRIMCVNCNICVNTLRRYPALALDSRVTALICKWVYPQILLEDDYVCEACRDLAITAVNNNLQIETPSSAEAGASSRGHTNVCLICGCSTHQRQKDKIMRDNPTEMQQSIINIIEIRLAPRKISSSDHVCHACWLRIKREVIRMNHQDESRPQLDTIKVEPQLEIIKAEPLEMDTIDDDVVQRVQNVIPSSVPTQRNQTVELPNYRRAANSSNTCVFPNCNSTTCHNISDKLRATVLHNHNYYLPKLARVCRHHLTNNTWDTLYESANSMKTFNIDQIQHVFSFVNAFCPTLDFDNVENMDDRVFEYWTGLPKERFNVLISEVPRINQLRRGSFGLAVFLLKMRTGDSDEKIAKLVQVPRRTLECLMDKVREILCQDFVPRYLGVDHLSRDELVKFIHSQWSVRKK